MFLFVLFLEKLFLENFNPIKEIETVARKSANQLQAEDEAVEAEILPPKGSMPGGADIHKSKIVIDPLEINVRLYRQISDLLAQLEIENVDIKTRYMALMAIARMQAVFVALRKEKFDEPNRGSAVRKYATAFQTNDPSRRKTNSKSKSAPEPEPEPDFSIDDLIGDDDADDAIA